MTDFSINEEIRKLENSIIHLERTLNIADEDEDEIEDIEREIRDLEVEIKMLEQQKVEEE